MQILIPLVAVGTHEDSKQKTKAFTELMKARAPNYGAFLTGQIAERLRAEGYQVVILNDVSRPADSPDSIDYEQVAFDGDIGFQAWIEEIGFYSGFASASYVPKVNVGAMSFTQKSAEHPYSASVYYGADARAGKDWAIEAAESAKFPSYEALVGDPTAVDEVYREAFRKIADRLVRQFKSVSPLAGATK